MFSSDPYGLIQQTLDKISPILVVNIGHPSTLGTHHEKILLYFIHTQASKRMCKPDREAPLHNPPLFMKFNTYKTNLDSNYIYRFLAITVEA